MKKEIIAIVGLGYWGTIVTNTIVKLNIFKKIYIHDSDIAKKSIKTYEKNGFLEILDFRYFRLTTKTFFLKYLMRLSSFKYYKSNTLYPYY